MSGWKTKAASTGMILMGLGTMIAGVMEFFDGVPTGAETVQSGFLMVTAGLAAMGIGHKIEKAGK